MRIAFCVQELRRGGGQMMIVKQTNGLARSGRHEVHMVVGEGPLDLIDYLDSRVIVTLRADAAGLPLMDITLFTWWATGLWCQEVPSRGFGQYLQSFEDRFTATDQVSRVWCTDVQMLGWPTVTESWWMKEELAAVAPAVPCWYVRNGIDKNAFGPTRPRPRQDDEPLRVVVEGSDAWFKKTRDALEGVLSASAPVALTYVSSWADWVDGELPLNRLAEYRQAADLTHAQIAALLRSSDVLIKLSVVEGMPGPPLEAMHSGCTVIATGVRGIEEYAVHGWNCALVPMADPASVGRWIDLLHGSPALLKRLRDNAHSTALAWPGDDHSATMFEASVAQMARLRYRPSHVPEEPRPHELLGVPRA